jgi:hypothetical protein
LDAFFLLGIAQELIMSLPAVPPENKILGSLQMDKQALLHDSKLQKVFRSVLDEIDLQHLRDSEPCRSFPGRFEMWQDVQKRFIIDAAIDYLEFGVFEGESIQWWTRLNTHTNSRFFGFDSFEGLPQDWHGKKGKGYFDVCGRLPQVEDPRIKFVKGWFENTLPIFIRDF